MTRHFYDYIFPRDLARWDNHIKKKIPKKLSMSMYWWIIIIEISNQTFDELVGLYFLSIYWIFVNLDACFIPFISRSQEMLSYLINNMVAYLFALMKLFSSFSMVFFPFILDFVDASMLFGVCCILLKICSLNCSKSKRWKYQLVTLISCIMNTCQIW